MPRTLKTQCAHGHEFSPENTYTSPQGLRYCRACKTRHKAEFLATASGPEKQRSYRKKWLNKNPGYEKNYWLGRTYGLTREQYEKMLADQDDRCAICNEVLLNPQVDHDHTTGKVRKLLCVSCNTGIGSFRENGELLAKAAAYLKEN